jgi:hypothetical protein
MRDCFFTSIATNYTDKALALADSVFKNYPDSTFVVSVVDYGRLSLIELKLFDDTVNSFAVRGHQLQFLDPMTLYERSDIFLFKYSIVEACTAVKPAVALGLLDSFEYVTYLDPDTILYTRLPGDVALGEDWSFQVTPHTIAPTRTPNMVSERLFLYFGTFNLGYFCARRTPQTLVFLRWWKQFCIDYGADAPAAGLFVDQKPVDLLPCFVDRTSVLRHAGCNVAWWNVFADERNVTPSGSEVTFDGTTVPLIFFHFSNLDQTAPSDQRLVARPLKSYLRRADSRAQLSSHPGLLALFTDYASRTSRYTDLREKLTLAPMPTTPLIVRLFFAEALRRGLKFPSDPFKTGNARVLLTACAHLAKTFRLDDLKAIIVAMRRNGRLIVSPSLLRHSS